MNLSVQAYLDPRKWWILVPLDVGAERRLAMVLDTGSPLSSISQSTYERLFSAGLIGSAARSTYVIRNLAIEGQPIADLVVRISRRVTHVGADGVLGLDFLARFTDVHCHIPTLRLTLTDS